MKSAEVTGSISRRSRPWRVRVRWGRSRNWPRSGKRRRCHRRKPPSRAKRVYRYALVAGVPASHYIGTLDVKPKGSGCIAGWRVDFLANNQPDIVVRTMVSTLIETGLGSLKSRFGVAK